MVNVTLKREVCLVHILKYRNTDWKGLTTVYTILVKRSVLKQYSFVT
jgi:hypothetical protein